MVATACRYGRAGLVDALNMPVRDLAMFNEAVFDLIAIENKKSPGSSITESAMEGGG